ncbi:MAG TPA: hypothetical protein VFR80_02345 [Pyrinomonadaceae bacterium]|nr:hypothetical protein [Pyrinomonadaceae bacterium]
MTNQITVAPKRVDPKELREEIEYALERRADREAERLRIEVNDGAVDLFGRVHSWQEKLLLSDLLVMRRGFRQSGIICG